MNRTLTAFAAALLLAVAPAASAQPNRPDIGEQRAALAQLSGLEGRWAGEGWMMGPDGARRLFRHFEEAAFHNGGALMTFKGVAHDVGGPEGAAPQFEAFATIAYDDAADTFAMQTFANGMRTAPHAVVNADGAFVWGFDVPGGRSIRYTIANPTPDVWFEIGETSTDGGATWLQFFEMRLNRLAP